MNTTATVTPAADLTNGTAVLDIIDNAIIEAGTKAPVKRTRTRKTAITPAKPTAKKAAPAKKAAAPKAEPKVIATKPAKAKIEVLPVDLNKLVYINTNQAKASARHLQDCSYYSETPKKGYTVAKWRKATKAEMTSIKGCQDCGRAAAKARIAAAAAKKAARKAPAKKVAATKAA